MPGTCTEHRFRLAPDIFCCSVGDWISTFELNFPPCNVHAYRGVRCGPMSICPPEAGIYFIETAEQIERFFGTEVSLYLSYTVL